MITAVSSKKIANDLIKWIRHYASLRIDSYLVDAESCIPSEVFSDLGKQGFFGMHISREYGGLELKTSDLLRVIEQIAAIDLSLTTVLIENIQGAHTLEKYASQVMKTKYLKKLAKGRIFTAGAMTESAAGSNPRAMEAIALGEKNGWVLSGSKRWVGMGEWAAVIAVYVQELDVNNNWVGMSGFLVPQGAKGLQIGPDSSTMGMRGFPKNTLTMDNIKVTAEQLLGKSGEGMEIAQDNMMYIRFCLAAASLGAMKRSMQLMVRYAKQRKIATGQLLENPVTLVQLSEMTAILDAIDNFVYLIAGFYDEDPSIVPEEAFVVAKLIGSEYLGWMADRLVQMLGARGYEEASGVSKLYRDARVFRIFEGPTEALNMYVGSRVLEKNKVLLDFISNTLNQKELFLEIQQAITKVNAYCLSDKAALFAKPFSVNYWAQALVGEIFCYGFLLAGINYSLSKNKSQKLERAALWLRNKYNELVETALKFSLPEKILMQTNDLQEYIADYADSIGKIDQTRKAKEVSIDLLLKAKAEPRSYGNGDNKPCADVLMKDMGLPDACIHQLFDAESLQNPDAIAVVYQDKKLTYQELSEKADRLAQYLIKNGIGTDNLVAIYADRSIEMIVGILGILKAGAAYLPLDYHYPEKRLAFMFEDSGAGIILAQRNLANCLPVKAQKTIFFEEVFAEPTSELAKNFDNKTYAENLGYVIYTSGSTGQPKGVMLTHKALTNLIQWHHAKISGKRNVLQFTTLNFDMSFLEIFSALSSGGTLVLISEKDRMDLQSFSKIIKNNCVEQLIIPVSFLKTLAESSVDKEYFHSLKEIIVAGEQLIITPKLAAFFNQLNSCKLLNYYGPAETHVVTSYTLSGNAKDWPQYVPIGQAIANTKIYLLDEKKEPVPIGASGEIYIGGLSLAKGYINRPALTEEKFIPNPWSDKPGAKLYRTGDYGKYLPDGNLVFLGRKDEQIKMRGFRIELQEIEAQLMSYPGIKEAVVMAKNDIFMDKHLEAFIVVEDGHTDSSIVSFLKERLPINMIPTKFHTIEKMPLTHSGKINKIELENTYLTDNNTLGDIISPRTEAEKAIISSIENIFKVKVGVNHSFAAIGGNSLLAMQIIAGLKDKFSVEIPSFSILSDPTLADTARRIDLLMKGN